MASMGIWTKLVTAITLLFLPKSLCGNSILFKEYIGAEGVNVKFTDVPINRTVEHHFILSFAIDYTSARSPSPTNGRFNVFWDTDNLSRAAVAQIKSNHKNVKVAVSLAGDVVGDDDTFVQFQPSSVSSWVSNAVPSLTEIVQQYHLDGIDIDYEHFKTDPKTFAECIGQLIVELKQRKVISFASIAPFEDDEVKPYYLALWKMYGRFIDHVNFQFYAYDESTTVEDFLKYYDVQASNYGGGKILASFATDPAGERLKPDKGFFDAVEELKKRNELEGIFIWSADDSTKEGFIYEKQSLALLAS